MADGNVSLLYRLIGEDAASPAFKRAGKSAEGLHTRMVAVGTAIGNLAAHAVTSLGGMAVGALKTGLQTAAGLQQAQLGFATLLGSEQAAGDYMKWLTGFAASTPFEMKGLVESSRTLIGVGVSAADSKSMLLNFGDAASAVGIQQDAFQRIMLATSQAISAGKFQAGDLNQIMTNGLPVWSILSKAMHKTVPELRDMAAHGKLLSKDVLPALQSQMHKDYGGAMAKQSETLNGLWSTFQDTLHLGMGQVLQPLVPILQKILPGAMDTLGKAFANVALAAKGFIDGASGGGGKSLSGVALTFHDFGVKAKDAFDKIKQAVSDSWPKVRAALQFVVDHKDVFAALGAGAATAAAGYKVMSAANVIYALALTAASIAQKLYAAATRDATVAQVGLDAAMDANPIGLIVLAVEAVIVAVAALVAGLIYAYQHCETFRNIVNGAFDAVKTVVLAVVGAVGAAWSTFVGALSTAGSKIGAVVSSIGGWFQALPGRVMGFLSALPGQIWGLIKTAVERAAYYWGYGLGLMVKEAMAFPGQVIGFLQALPGRVWDIIKTLATKGAAAFVSFVVAVGGHARDLAVTVGQKAAELVTKVIAFLKQLPGKALAAIKDLPTKIKNAVSDAGTWLLQAGKDVIAGLIKGIGSAVGGVVSAVKDIAGNILGGFRDAMDSHSPARKMIPLGQDVVRGIEEGLKSRAPALYNTLESLAQRVGNIKVTAGVKNMLDRLATDAAADIRAATAKFDAIKNAITSQRSKIAELVKARADYAATLASAASGGGITNIGLLQLDSQGRNAAAQQKVGDAQSAATDATQKFSDAQGRLNDLLEQQAARTSSSIAQLQALRDAQDAVTAAQATAAAAAANLTAASDAAKTATTNQATDFLEQLKARVRAAHTFTDDMNKLKAEGLSQDVLQQIAQAGLETGGALARALAEQGTPETIQGINAMSSKISEVSNQFGTTWAGQMLDSGIKAAEGILKGLQSKEAGILAYIRQLGEAMVAEIKRALKIKSPSGVMRDEVGAMIPAGLIAGIEAGAGGVASAMSGLVAIPSATGGRAPLGTAIGAGGSGTTVHVYLQNGIVGDAAQVGAYISEAIRRSGARGSGLTFA